MLLVAPALLFTAIRLRTSVFPASWDAQQKAGDVANVVEEDVTGVRVVKGFGQEQRELDRLTDRSRRMFGVAGSAREPAGSAAAGDADDPGPRVRSRCSRSVGGSRSKATSAWACSSRSRRYMLQLTPPVRKLAAILTVGQLARAGAERIFDLLDSTPLVQDKPDAGLLEVTNGEVRFDHVTFGYTSTEPVLQRLLAHGLAGRDRRARRDLGLGQVDRRPAAPALLRRARGPRDDRRRRRARRHARSRCASRSASCSRTRSSSPTRSAPTSRSPDPMRRRRGDRSGGARRRRRTSSSCGSRTATTPWSANRGSRSPVASGSASRSHARSCPIPASSCSTTRPRRSTRGSRRRSTRPCAGSLVGAHDDPHRAPPVDADARRSHRRGRQGPRGRHGDARRAVGALHAVPRCCSRDRATTPKASTRNPSSRRRVRWTGSRRTRGRASTPTSCAASRSRDAPQVVGAVACRRRWWRWRRQLDGRHGRFARADAGAAGAGRRAAARDRGPSHRPRGGERGVAELPVPPLHPAVPRRLVARLGARRARRGPARSRGRCSCATASTTASSSTPPRRCSRPPRCSSPSTLFDWWVMWAQLPGHGPDLRAAPARAAGQGVRPSPAARCRLLRARDGRPGHDAHDDRHRRAVAVAPERSGERARQPRHVLRRRCRARVHEPASSRSSPAASSRR